MENNGSMYLGDHVFSLDPAEFSRSGEEPVPVTFFIISASVIHLVIMYSCYHPEELYRFFLLFRSCVL